MFSLKTDDAAPPYRHDPNRNVEAYYPEFFAPSRE
jgi:hypothetical protein